jgi:hypothetical protein
LELSYESTERRPLAGEERELPGLCCVGPRQDPLYAGYHPGSPRSGGSTSRRIIPTRPRASTRSRGPLTGSPSSLALPPCTPLLRRGLPATPAASSLSHRSRSFVVPVPCLPQPPHSIPGGRQRLPTAPLPCALPTGSISPRGQARVRPPQGLTRANPGAHWDHAALSRPPAPRGWSGAAHRQRSWGATSAAGDQNHLEDRPSW